jgi:hypothetical protein
VSQARFERPRYAPFSVRAADRDGTKFLVRVTESVEKTQRAAEALLDTETPQVL